LLTLATQIHSTIGDLIVELIPHITLILCLVAIEYRAEVFFLIRACLLFIFALDGLFRLPLSGAGGHFAKKTLNLGTRIGLILSILR
jgi:hypothetical protein